MEPNKEYFAEQLIKSLKVYLPEDIAQRKMSVVIIEKNNGVVLTGIFLEGEKSGPIFYIDDLYDGYGSGELTEMEVIQISSRNIENAIKSEDLSFLENFTVDTFLDNKDSIMMLIHDVDIPSSKLDGCETYIPSAYNDDLIASFKVVLHETEEETACIEITKDMAKKLNVTGEELYNICLENSYGKDIRLSNMEDVLFYGGKTNLYDSPELLFEQDYSTPIYVLTNSNTNMGASYILNPKVADRISEILGCNYYVIPSSMEFVKYVEKSILVKKLSPEAIIYNLEKEGWPYKTKICLSTLYNYIRSGVFLNITMKDLPLPRKKKKKSIKFKKQKRISKGTSIEERPEHINNREEVGHWEGDTVIGSRGDSKECFLVLTQRASNIEVIEPLKSRTAKEVVKAFDRLEREMGEKNFRNTFKTITFDNGVEFSDVYNIERSRRNKKNRTKAFFCHAYSSWERGANENQNKFIRRFYPKGTEIKNLTRKKVKELQSWINTYPRHQYHGNSSLDMFAYLLDKNLEGF